MIELVAERGYGGVTVRELSRLAGVSTKSFYDCFANVEDCFVATYAGIVRETLRWPGEVPPASEDRLRARLRRFFTTLGTDPKAAGLVLVDAPSTGPALTARTRGVHRALERFIGAELAAVSSSNAIPKALSHGAATAALQLARSQLLSVRATPAATVADEFAAWLLTLHGDGSPGVWGLEAPLAEPGDSGESGQVSRIGDDRRFLIAAVTKLGMRDGYAKLTVPAICREAGVSRRVFNDCFHGVADCFLTAIESRVATALGRAEARARNAGSWEQGVVRATLSICGELGQEPMLARLVFVEILAPGVQGLELRERLLGRWARRLRRTAPKPIRPAPLAADASIAAAAAIVAANRRERMVRAAPGIAFTLIAPTLGSATAERVIAAEMRLRARAGASEKTFY